MKAVTLDNIGSIFSKLRQPTKALELFEQAFPIRRQVGEKSGEATTLSVIWERASH